MTTLRRLIKRYTLPFVLAALFVACWLSQPAMHWPDKALQAGGLLLLVALAVSLPSPHARARHDTMQEVLTRMEDRIDAIGFQLFEERTGRTAAERFFDERRRDPDYDQAYRQAWRALREPDSDVGPRE